MVSKRFSPKGYPHTIDIIKYNFISDEGAHLMKRILALTLCLIMLVPLFVSCGNKNEEGAVIRAYMTSDIYNFDPIYAYTDEAATKLMGMMYEGLFRLNAKNKVEKALCKDYEIVEDEEEGIYKMVITINETSWSDGRAVSVDDVIYAWKRILDPEFTCSIAPMLFDIKNARNYKNGDCSPDDVGLYAIDTEIMEIHFEQAINYDMFMENLCSPALVPLREDVISKSDDWSTNVAVIVCNGPFTLSSFAPGDKMALQRNSYYYRDSAKDAKMKVVKPYRIYIDLSVTPEEQLEAYKAKELFYNSEIPLSQRENMKSEVTVVDMQSVHTYYFNTNKELFKDARVRQALSMALDRQAIANIVVFGKPATGLITDGVFDTSNKDSFRDKGGDLISTSADVAGAQKLLKDAGVKKGEAFTITVRDTEVDIAIANYAKGVWENLGFKVDVKKLTAKEYLTEFTEYKVYKDQFKEAFMSGDYDVAAIDLQMLSSDAFSTLAGFALGYAGTALNLSDKENGWAIKPGVTGYNSEAYNAAIDKAFNEKNDRAKRAEALHEAEKILLEDMPISPLVTLQNAYVANKELSNFSFDYYGCPVFTKAKLKKYELYTDVEEKRDDEKEQSGFY